jgi:uncharacterized repeat protein (TIGR03803 family)
MEIRARGVKMKQIIKVLGKAAGAKRALAALVLCAATAVVLPGQTLTTLLAFDGPNGGPPYAALVQGADGNLYGTTQTGGAHNHGTIFKITPNGLYTRLYSFCLQGGPYCADGSGPNAPLIQAPDGDFYGTTQHGGADCGSGEIFNSGGTVFKISPGDTLTTLYTFSSVESGCNPTTGLVLGTDGNFYGTTEYGGTGYYQDGTVFKITPSGALTTIHNFCSQAGTLCPDGAYPTGLMLASDGNLYGTTEWGGSSTGIDEAEGTVFEITPSGLLTTLYSFCPSYPDCSDGANPEGGLIQAANGDFYGTTYKGGVNDNSGTVFEISPSGILTTLYSFCTSYPDCADGVNPEGGLVQAAAGDLYGTTPYGGAGGSGTIFTMTPSGTLTTLHRFCWDNSATGCGENPTAGLVQDTNGDFYGTTAWGYPVIDVDGTVFRLSVGLGPFVKTQTTFGEAGSAVNILGTDLTGVTSVSFNGAPAVFTVVSATEITAIVPAGATTGKVEVVTPGGTLLSNVPFRVLP